jgi:hypothetical protein
MAGIACVTKAWGCLPTVEVDLSRRGVARGLEVFESGDRSAPGQNKERGRGRTRLPRAGRKFYDTFVWHQLR